MSQRWLLCFIILCYWCNSLHTGMADATQDTPHIRSGLSTEHQSYEEDATSRVLSFDGDVWDFEGDESTTAIIHGSKANSMFGYSVALYDRMMIIGAVGANTSMGGAYIYFRHEDEVWRLDKFLSLDDAVVYDQFGCAVAMYDYTVVVGANKREAENGWKTDAGAAYVYEKSSGRWEMTMDLTPDDVTTQDYFGSSVAIHINTTVVGCWGCDSMGSFSGAAYVYSKWDGEWQFNEKIFANNGARYNWFGISVAIQDDLIVVGATGVVSGFTLEKAGGAYIYCNTHDDRQYDGMRYVECAELLPGDGQAGDSFGAAVAVDNGVVVIGSPKADHSGVEDAGGVYMYYRDTYDEWHYLQKMTAYVPTRDGHFGGAVGIQSDLVVVGGYNASGAGAVYLYGEEYALTEFDADTDAVWQLAYILTPEESEGEGEGEGGGAAEEAGDFYGYSVAVYGATVVVGAHGREGKSRDNRAQSHAGGVYSYYAGSERVSIPSRYVITDSSDSSSTMWVIVSVISAVVLLLGVAGGGFLAYNKHTYGSFLPSHRSSSSPISDWLPSSFSKAFGAEGEYSATGMDSSHGISSSHDSFSSTVSGVGAAGGGGGGGDGVNSSSAILGTSSQTQDKVSEIFADEESDDFDKDQQLLDDSLSKFQLKRQNRISLKKKKKEEGS